VEGTLAVAGALPSTSQWLQVMIAVPIVGLLLGLGAGHFLHRLLVRKRSGPLREVQRRRDGELAQIDAESREKVDSVRARTEKALEPFRARLAEVERKRAAIRAEGQSRVEAIEASAKQKTEQLQSNAAGKIAACERELASRVEVKPESAKRDFPPYAQAKRDGYKDGEKPPQRELERVAERAMREFMDSLSEEHKMALAVLAQQMPESQFAQLLSNLAGMSRSERRSLLAKVAPLAHLSRFGRF
jgi:hypothetical protein